MNLFTADDIKSIQDVTARNDLLLERLEAVQETVSTTVKTLVDKSKELINQSNAHQLIDIQAESLSIRQNLQDDIFVATKHYYTAQARLKRMTGEKFVYFSTGFALKTGVSEKTLLVESHLSEQQRELNIWESHIEFLRNTNKILESLNFAIKNNIELVSLLGKFV